MAVVRMIKYDDLSILPVIFSGAELAGVRSDRLPGTVNDVRERTKKYESSGDTKIMISIFL